MSTVTTPEWQTQTPVQAAQRRTVRVLIVTQIVGGVGVGAAASIGALLAQSVTNSETFAGIARTSSTLGAAVVGLPLALLAMRRGRRGALALGWALAATGGIVLVVAAATENVVLLVLGMLMFGSGSATNLQSRYAAADLASPAHRARALSVVVWSTTVGAVVGPNLAGPGATVSSVFSLPKLAGGFIISSACLFVAAVFLWVLLRPDPLLLARKHEADAAAAADPLAAALPTKGVRMGEVVRHIASLPMARFAFVSVVLGHTVMGAVMTMTPVDMADHGASLTIVGFTISMHVLGMYAFSPVVGWLTDRIGRITVVLIGQGIFIASALFAGLSRGSVALVTIGLFLLGLGWSFSLVAGSAMLGEAVSQRLRPAVQGTADTTMNVVSAIAAGVSGPAMATIGFGGLNVLAGILVIPVVLLAPSVIFRNGGSRDGSAPVGAPAIAG